jgi:hypothetical protein
VVLGVVHLRVEAMFFIEAIAEFARETNDASLRRQDTLVPPHPPDF